MTAALERRLTEAEYLELERRSEVRHEFINGRMLEMPGASMRHEAIVLNIATRLRQSARQRECRVGIGGTQLRTPNGLIYYPDVMIACLDPTDTHIETAPCFLLEVLSPSTEAKDRGQKFEAYTSIPTLGQYVLVSQDERRLTVFTRGTDDWRVQSFTSGEVGVACLGTALTLEQVYEGIDFGGDLSEHPPAEGSPSAP